MKAFLLPAILFLAACFCLSSTSFGQEAEPSDDGVPADAKLESAGPTIYVVPIRTQIGRPTLFALRAGIKDAIAQDASILVLDMDTPGGELGVTLEMMKLLDRFAGKTVTFVDEEAMSAGAIIASVTDEIHYTPRATIGAAEPVSGSGQDIDESMKRKVVSYMKSKIRAYTDDGKSRYRSEVLAAMIDPSTELEIDGKVLSGDGDLLSLSAGQAMETYGEPPEPLLGDGIHESMDDFLQAIAGGKSFSRVDFEASWSLELAHLLMYINPLLLGVGGLLLFAEFKSPGFGIFGIAGIACIGIVFFGHNVAGLADYSAFLVFMLGAALVLIELLFVPGVLVLALPGALLMFGALVWGMADIWPADTPNYEFTPDVFLVPIYNILGGLIIAVLLVFAFMRFMPKSFVYNRMILSGSVRGTSQGSYAAVPGAVNGGLPQVGDLGVATTDLYPTGEIEIGGRRFSAQLDVGSLGRGARVRIVREGTFGYFVEEALS